MAALSRILAGGFRHSVQVEIDDYEGIGNNTDRKRRRVDVSVQIMYIVEQCFVLC